MIPLEKRNRPYRGRSISGRLKLRAARDRNYFVVQQTAVQGKIGNMFYSSFTTFGVRAHATNISNHSFHKKEKQVEVHINDSNKTPWSTSVLFLSLKYGGILLE